MADLRQAVATPQSRVRVTAAVAGTVVAVLVAILGLKACGAFRHDPQYTGDARVEFAATGTPDGSRLLESYNSLAAARLQLIYPAAAFLTMNWSTSSSPDPRCQVQLLAHTPTDWRLVGWAGDQPISNATINSLGTIQSTHPELRDSQQALVLPTTRSGHVVLVWGLMATSVQGAALIHLHLAYACGDADRSASVLPISIT